MTNLLAAAVFAGSLAAVVAQQTAPPTPPPPVRPAEPAKPTVPQAEAPTGPEDQSVVVQGCLERSDAASDTAGTATTDAAAGNAREFKLTRALVTRIGDPLTVAGMRTTPPVSTVDPPTATQATERITTRSEFPLASRPGMELSSHVGHPVEIVATAPKAAWTDWMAASGWNVDPVTGEPTASSPAPRTVTRRVSAPVLTVTIIKQTGATCR